MCSTSILAASRNDSYSDPLNPNYNKGLGDFGSHATPFASLTVIAGGAR